jgi:hypothetical protein
MARSGSQTGASREASRDPRLAVTALPWTLARHEVWAAHYRPKDHPDGSGTEDQVPEDKIVGAIAGAVSTDVKIIAEHRDRRRLAGEDPDSRAQGVTRFVLAAEFGSRRDQALLKTVPNTHAAEVVSAYGSYQDFRSRCGDVAIGPAPPGQEVLCFDWRMFVPADSRRSDVDLLREAVELAETDEVAGWRAALGQWRLEMAMKGVSTKAALANLDECTRGYAAAAKKRKIGTRARRGMAVMGVATGVAAVFVPPIGIASALCGLGSFIPVKGIPAKFEVGAMFHQAKRAFG